MDNSNIFIVTFIIFSFSIFLLSLYQVQNNRNPFGMTPFLLPLGIFVWADGILIGLFWTLVSLVCFLLNDWILFLLIVSLFWSVRSLGEIIYWINQQFSQIDRNPPKTLYGHHIFQNDSIWFVYQIFWQCLLVISLVFNIYLASIWLT